MHLGDDIGNTLALRLPTQRRVDGQVKQNDFLWQSLVEDRSLDVRSQGRQVDHAADVAAVDLFSIRDFGEVARLPALDLPQPTVTLREMRQRGHRPFNVDRELDAGRVAGVSAGSFAELHMHASPAPAFLYSLATSWQNSSSCARSQHGSRPH